MVFTRLDQAKDHRLNVVPFVHLCYPAFSKIDAELAFILEALLIVALPPGVKQGLRYTLGKEAELFCRYDIIAVLLPTVLVVESYGVRLVLWIDMHDMEVFPNEVYFIMIRS